MPDWEAALADVEAFARKTVAEGRFIGGAPKVFVAGESMGGALAFDLADRFPDLITGGAILVSPMCAIHEKMKPPPAVIEGFRAVIGKPGSSDGVRGALGKLPLAPSADIGDYCYKDQNMRVIAEDVPSFYGRKPRLATARELLNVTDRISASLGAFVSGSAGTERTRARAERRSASPLGARRDCASAAEVGYARGLSGGEREPPRGAKRLRDCGGSGPRKGVVGGRTRARKPVASGPQCRSPPHPLPHPPPHPPPPRRTARSSSCTAPPTRSRTRP